MASASGEGFSTEGPVLSLVTKRLRALRKKYNRILQMEEALANGKPLNKEQEEVLRSKPAVIVLIDEYERLRQPLSAALQDEISRFPPPPQPPTSRSSADEDAAVEDILKLLYFSSLFDVKPQPEFNATMLTRTHERDCCLTYDYVTDDANADLLGEGDLDAISSLGALLTSRPASSGVSHRDALLGCVQHARLWLQNSYQAIHPGASITYSGLRERLNKILASDYYTTTPEMKAPVDVAAAVEKYTTACQVQVSETGVVLAPDCLIEGHPDHEQDKEDEHEDYEESQSKPDQPSHVEELPKLNDSNSSSEDIPSEQEHQKLEPDLEEEPNQREEQQYTPRRQYTNHRGGGRGGGRRGYPNGRGGRGGRGGGYQNGCSHYDHGYRYSPRGYPNPRGRGGRSGDSNMYNNQGPVNHGGHIPQNSEMGAVS